MSLGHPAKEVVIWREGKGAGLGVREKVVTNEMAGEQLTKINTI